MQATGVKSVFGQQRALPCSRSSAAASRSAARRSFALVVRAEGQPVVPPPKGVSLPPRTPQVPPARFGFVYNAERLNSRASMIGFFALLLVEAVAGKPILEMLGLQLGNGINIAF